MSIRITAAHPSHVQFGHRLTSVPLPAGLPTVDRINREIEEYTDVLLGRVDPPVDSPYLQLMEVAAAYYARARELEILIFEGEQNGSIKKGDPHYRVRTGQLNSFIEMARKMFDLGSRRLTQEQLISAQRLDHGERL